MSETERNDSPDPHTVQPVTVVIRSLHASALFFAIAGLWLMLGERSLLPAETARIAGPVFLLVAFGDLMAVRLLRASREKQERARRLGQGGT
jgi:hypothetical protein